MLEQKNIVLKNGYKTYRNKLNNLIKLIKRQYFQNTLKKYSKNVWNTIKEISNDKQENRDPDKINSDGQSLTNSKL